MKKSRQNLISTRILLGVLLIAPLHFVLAKPIPDEEWKAIVGLKASETYTIVRGDTLSKLSHRLFGDLQYWPKIWALNNPQIKNPHKIYPGMILVFSPGTGNSLPAVALNEIASSEDKLNRDTPTLSDTPSTSALVSKKSMKSNEWRLLPKQAWEVFETGAKATSDIEGFGKNTRLSFGEKAKGFDAFHIAATEKLPYIAQVIGGQSEGTYLGPHDMIYIRADESIEIGKTYGITEEPALLKSVKSDRVGLSYPYLGKVKILGAKDDLFVGNIVSAQAPVSRGSSLIALPPRLFFPPFIPGPSPVTGTLIVDRSSSTYATAQFKEVFIDRGTDDGIKPGMVFRVFKHVDPSDQRKLISANFIVDADILVVQTSEEFSLGIVLSAKSTITEQASAVLLTDISDVGKNPAFMDGRQLENYDQLDQLDQPDEGLKKDEKKVLRQLENWKEENSDDLPDPTAGSESSAPATAPTVMDEDIPPAPTDVDPPAPVDSGSQISDEAPPPPLDLENLPAPTSDHDVPPPPEDDTPPPPPTE